MTNRFLPTRARKVIRFVQRVYKAIGLVLPKFQRRLICKLYGNVNARGTRRYRRCYYSTPRKNAKSTLAAALCLYHLFADGEPNPRVYICATVLEQTEETFEILTRMIAGVPKLNANCIVFDSRNRKQVQRYVDGKKRGFIKCLTSRGSKEGKNPSLVIFDEFCDWKALHRPLYNSMTMGSFARPQSLFLITTTAGDADAILCREQYEYAKKVEAGTIQDDQLLVYIIECNPVLWSNHAEQVRCNPLVVEGFIDPEAIAAEFRQIAASPHEVAKFKNKRLNIWVGSTLAYLDPDKWITGCRPIEETELQRARRCFAGLDLARKDDFNALCLLFELEPIESKPRWFAKFFLWIPADGIKDRGARDGQPYEEWARRELVTLAPGPTVDYHLILERLKELKKQYTITEIGADEWHLDYLGPDIEALGLVVSPFRQGYKSMSPALKELQAMTLNDQISHEGNEIVGWMAGNLNVKEDDARNVKPAKASRKFKIDGMVALTMAVGVSLRNRGPRLVSALKGFTGK